MSQIALPLAPAPGAAPRRIVIGNANQTVVEALRACATWPYRTAILMGPPRSGKSLFAEWFVSQGLGEAVDDAPSVDETVLFHRWNRAQAAGTPLLLTASLASDGTRPWQVTLPDLASRLGAALRLEIGAPDDSMMAELIIAHAEARGLPLAAEGATYLANRAERSHLAAERLVMAIDRISLERKVPPGQVIWREALDEVAGGAAQGKLI